MVSESNPRLTPWGLSSQLQAPSVSAELLTSGARLQACRVDSRVDVSLNRENLHRLLQTLNRIAPLRWRILVRDIAGEP